MSKEASIIAIGALVIVAPFLGLPGSWRTALLLILGVSLVIIGVVMRRDVVSRGETKGASFFVENRARDDGSAETESPRPKIQ